MIWIFQYAPRFRGAFFFLVAFCIIFANLRVEKSLKIMKDLENWRVWFLVIMIVLVLVLLGFVKYVRYRESLQQNESVKIETKVTI